MHLAGGPGEQDRALVTDVPPARERLAEGRQREGNGAADLLGVGGREHRGRAVGRPRRGPADRLQAKLRRPPLDAVAIGGADAVPAEGRAAARTGSHSGTTRSSAMIRSATR